MQPNRYITELHCNGRVNGPHAYGEHNIKSHVYFPIRFFRELPRRDTENLHDSPVFGFSSDDLAAS